ncbi:TlpA family protein disulfide reductase [Actinocorallia populi]|uniref:TlpA family protein disulfide reductase n=1 Tax=Actinocorallia populi TaxID=2079200 RepID=UPI0013005B55|nr:redoxin domain-containing protein [Actinocorallia populi]
MRKLISALAVTLLAVTACGGETEEKAPMESASAAPAMSDAPTTKAPTTGTSALWKFRATSLDGEPFDGSGLEGKPVVLWFWAPWCPTCQGEGPAVSAAAKKYAGKVEFVGVAGLDKNKEQMDAFVSRTGTANFVHLDDRTGALYKHFKVKTQSSYLLVNPEGGTHSAVGPLSEADLSELIDQFAL